MGIGWGKEKERETQLWEKNNAVGVGEIDTQVEKNEFPSWKYPKRN